MPSIDQSLLDRILKPRISEIRELYVVVRACFTIPSSMTPSAGSQERLFGGASIGNPQKEMAALNQGGHFELSEWVTSLFCDWQSKLFHHDSIFVTNPAGAGWREVLFHRFEWWQLREVDL
jgi:hypothetical protein